MVNFFQNVIMNIVGLFDFATVFLFLFVLFVAYINPKFKRGFRERLLYLGDRYLSLPWFWRILGLVFSLVLFFVFHSGIFSLSLLCIQLFFLHNASEE